MNLAADLFATPGEARIRCISLWQPWASLWLLGWKVHETRDWKPSFINPPERIVVHAAKTLEGLNTIDCALHAVCVSAFGADYQTTLPRGAALGTITLADFRRTEELIDTLHPMDWDCGNFSPGRWAWRGERPELFAKPLPMRGNQGFWFIRESDLPQ